MPQPSCWCGFPATHTHKHNFQGNKTLLTNASVFLPFTVRWIAFYLENKKKSTRANVVKTLSLTITVALNPEACPQHLYHLYRSEGDPPPFLSFKQGMLEDTLQNLEFRSHSTYTLQFSQCLVLLFLFLPHLGIKLLFMIKEANLSPHTHTTSPTER